MGWLTNPKKAAYNRVYNRTTAKACYVATAVYGSDDVWQVARLRRFRDEVLLKSVVGSLFVLAYYSLSPKLAAYFGGSSPVRGSFRKLLDSVVNRLPD